MYTFTVCVFFCLARHRKKIRHDDCLCCCSINSNNFPHSLVFKLYTVTNCCLKLNCPATGLQAEVSGPHSQDPELHMQAEGPGWETERKSHVNLSDVTVVMLISGTLTSVEAFQVQNKQIYLDFCSNAKWGF